MSDVLFATQFSKGRSPPVSPQRLVNAYAEAEPPDAKTSVAVFGVPGIDGFTELGMGPIRGMYQMNNIAYAVSGSELYSFDDDGIGTLRGTGITGGTVVSVDGNGTQIAIATGVKGWTYTPATTTFAEITDAQFQDTAETVTFIDGYFAFDWPDTNKFFISDLYDGTSYAATMFASAESSPDLVQSVLNYQGVLLVLGDGTIEVWDSTGALSFPFQPRKGSTIPRGIAAPRAMVREDNAVFLLGADRVAYRLGAGLSRISTHAEENAWEDYADVSDAFCFTWSHDGHKFIVFQFPSASATFVFDVATGRWHERTSWDPTGADVRWRGNCALAAYGMTLIGDANSGRIGFIDHDIYTEFDDPIRLIAVMPTIHGRGKRVFMPFFELDMETGVGLPSGQGSDPQVMLDWTDDGGRTFVNPQLPRSFGKIGEYTTRVQWDRLGSFYQRSLRIQITDPVKRVILAARCPGLSTGV